MLKIEKEGKASVWYEVGNKPLREILKELEPNTKVYLYRAYSDDSKDDIYEGMVKNIPNDYCRINNVVYSAYQNRGEDIFYIATTDFELEK